MYLDYFHVLMFHIYFYEDKTLVMYGLRTVGQLA